MSLMRELGETYHAAQQASFRGTTWQQTKLRSCFCGFRFGAGTILKMTVADGRRGRQYMPILR